MVKVSAAKPAKVMEGAWDGGRFLSDNFPIFLNLCSELKTQSSSEIDASERDQWVEWIVSLLFLFVQPPAVFLLFPPTPWTTTANTMDHRCLTSNPWRRKGKWTGRECSVKVKSNHA